MCHMRFDKKAPSLRIFFATDFHGSEIVFRKFLNSLKFYQADVLIFGGDITGKVIVPIVKREGTYYSSLYGRDVTIQSESELHEFAKVNKNKGYYPKVVTKDEYDEIEANKEHRDRLFKELMKERLVEWAKLAQERLAGSKHKLYWEAGNDDAYAIDEVMETESCVLIGDRMVELGDYRVLGLSHANMTAGCLGGEARGNNRQGNERGRGRRQGDNGLPPSAEGYRNRPGAEGERGPLLCQGGRAAGHDTCRQQRGEGCNKGCSTCGEPPRSRPRVQGR